jgi:hypothetical protein
MATAIVALVLELYVPPVAGTAGLDRAVREVYRPLVRLLERRPRAALTVAVDPWLALELVRHGHGSVLHALGAATERGQVELSLGSRNHALLPLLPPAEAARQLALGEEAMREALGRTFRPLGLVPPQLAYARIVAEIAAARGLHWLLCDELALGRFGAAPTTTIAVLAPRREPSDARVRGPIERWHQRRPPVPRRELRLHFRDRELSRRLCRGELRDGRALARAALDRAPGGHVVLAVPAELFEAAGPAFVALDDALSRSSDELLLVTVDALGALFPGRTPVEPLPSSWRTTPEELASGRPFAAWSGTTNELQAMLWRLASLAWNEAARREEAGDTSPETGRLRDLLDDGLHSSTFRFASEASWDPPTVRRGAATLLAALEAGGDGVPPEARSEARSLATRIDQTVSSWEAGRALRIPGAAAPASTRDPDRPAAAGGAGAPGSA